MGPKPKKQKTSDQPDQTSVRIQLRIDSSEVSVGKAALVAESAYFATMFAGNFKESDSTIIELQQPADVSLKALVKLVESVGRDVSELSIDRKEAVKVWMAARYLQMEKAEKMAAGILDEVMKRPKHAYRLWRSARRDALVDLETLTSGVILKNFLHGAKFLQFPKPCETEFLKCSVDEVTDLLSHEDFVPQSEAMVYQMIMWWCMHNATERMRHIHPLLSGCVAWDDLDVNLLIATASGQLLEALKQIAEERQMGCGALLKRAAKKEAIFYHMRKGHPHQLLRFDFIRNELTKLDTPVQAKLAECWARVNADGFAVALGRELILPVKTDGKYDDVIAMDCISGATRTIMADSPFHEECMCVVAVGTELFGASGDNRHLVNWHCFDLATGQVRRASKMEMHEVRLFEGGCYSQYDRESMEAVPIGRETIVFSSAGSVNAKHENNPECKVELYDVRSNKWTQHTCWMEDEKKFHHRCGTIVLDEYLYYTGGCVDAEGFSFSWKETSRATTACFRVSLSEDRLDFPQPESIANLNIARYHHCVFIKDGDVWVYGGTTHVGGNNQRKRALMSFERYDVKRDEWTLMDVPMTKELKAEVAGGDYAQKTFCLPLHHRLPPECLVGDIEGYYEEDQSGDDAGTDENDSGTDEDDIDNAE